jgi:hypothetical protein
MRVAIKLAALPLASLNAKMKMGSLPALTPQVAWSPLALPCKTIAVAPVAIALVAV